MSNAPKTNLIKINKKRIFVMRTSKCEALDNNAGSAQPIVPENEISRPANGT